MNTKNPLVSIILIGINEELHISDAIEAALSVNYPQESLEILFVDGGSTDRTVSIAKQYPRVKVIEMHDPHPTPGRGRNLGFQHSRGEIIQFLDADTCIDPNWLQNAIPQLKSDRVAICGYRHERFPKKNMYHLIADLEWNGPPGPSKNFGGDVLIERSAVQTVGGYDENLIAAEDDDLSVRIRQQGGNIYRMNAIMTLHDINMNKFSQYLKRCFRTGYAYAEIGLRYGHNNEQYFRKELFRITLGSLAPLAIILSCAMANHTPIGISAATLIALRSFGKTHKIHNQFNLSILESLNYSLHLAFVIYPQFAGAMRYMITLLTGKPLRNRVRDPNSSVTSISNE